jgi:NIMA (never in mitosis gene a)-related kinase
VKRIIDNTEYALKKVKLSSLDHKEKESALNEIRILASIQSQFIISYKDAFLDESSNTLCIVMEIATDGDLLNKINKAKK